MKVIKRLLGSSALAGFTFMAASPVCAEIWNINDFQFDYAPHTTPDGIVGGGAENHGPVRSYSFIHYGATTWGDDQFIFRDFSGSNVGSPGNPNLGQTWNNGATNNQLYTLSELRFSLSKLTGNNFSFGLIDDVYVKAQGEYATFGTSSSYKAPFTPTATGTYSIGVGPSVDLKIPGFDWVQVSLLARHNNYDRKIEPYLSAAWSATFQVQGRDVRFEGYGLATGTSPDPDGNGGGQGTNNLQPRVSSYGTRILIEPQLMVNLGSHVWGGIGFTYHAYKNPPQLGYVGSYHRTDGKLVLKYNF